MSARKIKRSLRVHTHVFALWRDGKQPSWLSQYRRWNQ